MHVVFLRAITLTLEEIGKIVGYEHAIFVSSIVGPGVDRLETLHVRLWIDEGFVDSPER